MRITAFTPLQLLLLFCLASSVFATEQRVLLSFDNAGHRVSQIVRPQFDDSLRQEVHDSFTKELVQPDMDALVSFLEPGVAMLVWIDDQGHSRARTSEPDPRVSHAPNHIDGVDGTTLGNISGAWLVSGPESASSVMILLPSNLSLGLAFEQWHVSLIDW